MTTVFPLSVALHRICKRKPSRKPEIIPFVYFFDQGLRVTVNTDNRLVTNTTMTDELYLLHKELNFTLDEMKELIIMGFKSSFLPYDQKRRMLADIVTELKNFKPDSLESIKEQL